MRHPFRNGVRMAKYFMDKGMLDDPEGSRASLLDALRGADAAVVHPTFATALQPVADHLGVPTVVGHLFPMMIPTREWLPIAPRHPRSLGRAGNRLAWRAFARGTGALMGDRGINAFRASVDQPPLRGNALLGWTSAAATVILVNRTYFGRHAQDWEGVSWGGFSHWAGPRTAPDPAVEAYVDAGEAPVLVSLGTSAATGAGPTFARIAADLDQLGLRSLLLVGDAANLDHVGHRPGAFTFAPLGPLLPRCRVAVVSGALGSLGAALAAGVPVVVAPQLFDQVWHGQRVQELGVGRMALRPGSVAKAVARIDADPSYRERARALGEELRAEDGAGALADAVERVLAGT